MGSWFSKVGTDSFYASLDKQLQHLQEDTQRLQVAAVHHLSRACCSRVLPNSDQQPPTCRSCSEFASSGSRQLARPSSSGAWGCLASCWPMLPG